MIREKELNPHNHPLTADQRRHFLYHYFAVNELRAVYGRAMVCTSGVRSLAEHLEVYRRINAEHRRLGRPEVPIPMASKHLAAAASDYLDPDMALYRWCELREELLADLGIYVERRRLDDGMVHTHLQTLPPPSGRRFFDP